MEMKGEQRILASRQVVWEALNDPEILKACIPGCEELIKLSDTDMTAVAVIKVGPVRAKFQGAVTLSDLDPPNGYRISGEGQGGIAGFAKGSAVVRLREDGDATLLSFEVLAEIGGKLSQLGARLIDATAKQLSAAFFRRFAEEIDRRAAPQGEAGAAADAAPASAASGRPRHRAATGHREAGQRDGFGLTNAHLVWLIVVAGLVVAAFFLLGGGAPGEAVATRNVAPEFSSAVLLLMAGAIGYLFGRQSATQTLVQLDADAVDALAEALLKKRDGR